MRAKLACGLLAVLLASAIPATHGADADTPLQWSVVEKPGEEGGTVVSPSELSRIAVGDDGVLYAIDSENARVYRSLDAGLSWEELTRWLEDAGAGLPADEIAIAPDKAGIVAVVTDAGTKVYASGDGGLTWFDMRVPILTGTIRTVAVSVQYTQSDDQFWDVAIGTAVWGDAASTGQLWVRPLGESWEPWRNQELAVDPSHVGADISALAFSPDYESDGGILAVASTGIDVSPAYQNGTWLCLGERDTSTGTTSWNGTAGYPAEIIPAGDDTGVSRLHSCLALPTDYSSEEASTRRLFVSCDREPDAWDDVYRMDDSTSERLDADGGHDINVCSISYDGTLNSGTLLAGDADPIAGSLTVEVRRSPNALDPYPIWHPSSVPPTGPGDARVSWNPDGDVAYCGTGQSPGVSLDESALSASSDGDKWRQLSLMDTSIRIADMTPAPDSKSLFMTTYNPHGPEGVWRTAGYPLGERWVRVLAVDSENDALILRLSEDYDSDNTMYVAAVDSDTMAVSYNRGNTWDWCDAPGPVVDAVVAGKKTVYVALPDGCVSRTTDSAWTWNDESDTGLPSINMLALAGDHTLLVGGRNGGVAYSTDGGTTFVKTRGRVGDGDVQVVADAGYTENGLIYAASNSTGAGIWRWVLGASTQWLRIDEALSHSAQGPVVGLEVGPEGTLYALRLDTAAGCACGVARSLNPSACSVRDIEFDWLDAPWPAGVFDPHPVFPTTMPRLRLSGDSEQNELWAFPSAEQRIYRYQDTLCKVGPQLASPEDEAILEIGCCSCDSVTSLFLHWQELSETLSYQAAIYLDQEAIQTLWSGTSDDGDIMAVGADGSPELEGGNVYYWRARSVEPIRSPWSELWSFSPSLGGPDWSPLALTAGVSPSPGATDVGTRPVFKWNPAACATAYELVLATDYEFSDPVLTKLGDDALSGTAWTCDRELSYSTSYFWKVRAISSSSIGDWMASTFTTEAAPSPGSFAGLTPTSPVEPASSISSTLLWVLVGVAAALAAALSVAIMRTRNWLRRPAR